MGVVSAMDWKSFEELVQYFYQELLNINGEDIVVQRNKKIRGISGQENQIDVYFEYRIVNIIHRVAVECKLHNRPISIDYIKVFESTVRDIGNCTGIIVSSSGFQQGAKEYAKVYGIHAIAAGEEHLVSQILAEKIKVLLPDSRVIGQPFWTLMEEANNGSNISVTGSYIDFNSGGNKQAIGLFLSKKWAETAVVLWRSSKGCKSISS